VRRSDQVLLPIITLLFGAQQSVLGRDTPCLDSPGFVFAVQCRLPEGNELRIVFEYTLQLFKYQNKMKYSILSQHDNGYMGGQSQIKVHTDERTQVHSAQSSLAVTHPSTNQARCYLTSVTESPSKHWSPLLLWPYCAMHVSDIHYLFIYSEAMAL